MNAQKTRSKKSHAKQQREDGRKIHHRETEYTEADSKAEGFDLSSAERLAREATVNGSSYGRDINAITTGGETGRSTLARRTFDLLFYPYTFVAFVISCRNCPTS